MEQFKEGLIMWILISNSNMIIKPEICKFKEILVSRKLQVHCQILSYIELI